MSSFVIHVPIELNQPQRVRIGKRDYAASLGPMDFPQALRVTYSKAPKARLTIAFIYGLDPDEGTLTRTMKDLSLAVGKNSGRVMSLSIDLGDGPPTGKLREVTEALERLRETAEREQEPPRKAAYYGLMAGRIMPTFGPEIESSLAALRKEQRGLDA